MSVETIGQTAEQTVHGTFHLLSVTSRLLFYSTHRGTCGKVVYWQLSVKTLLVGKNELFYGGKQHE